MEKKRKSASVMTQCNEYFLIAVFIAMIIVLALQVVARTFFNTAFAWVEEVARYLFVILIMGGAAQAYKKGLWISVDIFSTHLPYRGKLLMDIVMNLFALLFCGFMVILGIVLFRNSTGQLTPALQFEVRYVYLALPVFFFQISYFSVKKIIGNLSELAALGRKLPTKKER